MMSLAFLERALEPLAELRRVVALRSKSKQALRELGSPS